MNTLKKERIVLFTGGREYGDVGTVYAVLNKVQPTQVVVGCAKGADALVRKVVNQLNTVADHDKQIVLRVFKAQWEIHGKKAGFLRNIAMLDVKPNAVIAFPGGRGTTHCASEAFKRQLPTYLVDADARTLRSVKSLSQIIQQSTLNNPSPAADDILEAM